MLCVLRLFQSIEVPVDLLSGHGPIVLINELTSKERNWAMEYLLVAVISDPAQMTCQIALAGRSADGPSRTRSMPWPTGSPPPPG